MPAGSIVVDLLMRTGSFETDTDRAEKRLKALKKAAAETVAAATAGLIAVGATGFAALARLHGELASIADLQGISEKIGDTASAVASLKRASDLSGVSMDTLAGASVKLTASLSKTDDEAKGAGAALAALGLNLADFKRLSPTDQLEAVAKAMSQFEDGANKTAVAVALFGKSGAELIPFLNDLANVGKQQITLTDQQIAQADQYQKSQAALRNEYERFVQHLSISALPTFTNLQKVFADMARDEDNLRAITAGLDGAMKAVIVTFQATAVLGANVAFAFGAIGREIAALSAQADALGVGFKDMAQGPIGVAKALARAAVQGKTSWSGFTAISDAVKEDNERALAQLNKFTAQIMSIGKVTAAPQVHFSDAAFEAGRRKQLNFSGVTAAAAADDPTRKLLDNHLKGLQRVYAEEAELMSQRQRILDTFNSQGLVSVRDYYTSQQAILDEATAAQSRAYDEQIAALRAYQAQATKRTEQAEIEGKINDLLFERAKLHRNAGFSAIEMGLKESQAMKDYRAQVEEINARLQELKGNLSAAALIRFDATNERLRNLAATSGDTDTLEKHDALRAYTATQAELNKLTADHAQQMQVLSMAEDRISLNRQLGVLGELDGLQQLGRARQDALAVLRQQLAVYERIPKAMQTDAQILAVQRLKLEIDKLSAAVDPLADKFNTIFKDSFSDAFSDFVKGTKSAGDAFRAFADDVFNQITRLAAQDIAGRLFGGKGGGFNIGSFIGGIFGGSAKNPLDILGVGLPSFDVGTPYVPTDMIAKVHQGERILTVEQNRQFSQGGSGMVVHNTFVLNEPASRQSQQQVAAAASMAIERARRRNG